MIPLFPDPREAGAEGLLAMGGSLSVETLEEAYTRGIFPWPQEGSPMLWFSPDPRGVLDFDDLHLSKSFLKWQRGVGASLRVTFNEAFDQVISACSEVRRPGQDGTWILPPMISSYRRLFALGKAESVEVWRGQKLVGGLYGVRSARYFSAESMFYRESNASKLSLVSMVERLRGRGDRWMDIQMVTEVTSRLGGKWISREEFLQRIGQ